MTVPSTLNLADLKAGTRLYTFKNKTAPPSFGTVKEVSEKKLVIERDSGVTTVITAARMETALAKWGKPLQLAEVSAGDRLHRLRRSYDNKILGILSPSTLVSITEEEVIIQVDGGNTVSFVPGPGDVTLEQKLMYWVKSEEI